MLLASDRCPSGTNSTQLPDSQPEPYFEINISSAAHASINASRRSSPDRSASTKSRDGLTKLLASNNCRVRVAIEEAVRSVGARAVLILALPIIADIEYRGRSSGSVKKTPSVTLTRSADAEST